MAKQETREVRLTLRFSESEYASLLGAATGADRTVSDMARVLILRALKDSGRTQ